jgi:hypothetical protein
VGELLDRWDSDDSDNSNDSNDSNNNKVYCISKENINNRTKLTWECKQKHQWESDPNDSVIYDSV